MIITGTGFGDGATVTVGGTAATSVVVVDSTTITCLTPAHAGGLVNVVVTNPDAQAATLTNAFRYVTPTWKRVDTDPRTPDELILAAAAPGPTPPWTAVTEQVPVIYFVVPNVGLTDGRDPNKPDTNEDPLQVNIGGAFFVDGATVTFGGNAASNVVVKDQHTISCLIPAHAVGLVDVVVTCPDSGSGLGTVTLTGGFTYLVPAPVVLGLTIMEGSTAGSTATVIRGRHFTSGAVVSFGGLLATSVVVTNDQQITCNTPAHTAGVVDVRVDILNA